MASCTPSARKNARAKLAVAVPLHDLRMRATATPTEGPSRLRSLDYDGHLEDSGPRFACVVRAFEAAREFAGRMDQSFEITTRSDFPHERGLGSSAAASGAIIRAVLEACGRRASTQELFALTQSAETVAHGRPSGWTRPPPAPRPPSASRRARCAR